MKCWWPKPRTFKPGGTRGLHRLRLWLWADFPSSPVRAFWREGSKFQAGKTKIGEILGLDPFAFSASSRLASASTKAVIAFWNPVSCLRQARSLVHPSDFLFLRHVSVPVSSTESSRTLSVRGIIPTLEGGTIVVALGVAGVAIAAAGFDLVELRGGYDVLRLRR